MISHEAKQRVISALSEKIPKPECPLCHNSHFIIADGYVMLPLQDEIKGFSIGGPAIPSIPVICSNCGFTSLYALGALGLLDDAKDNQEGNDAQVSGSEKE